MRTGKKIADYWDVSKKLLMDSRFIDRLKEYDRDNIEVTKWHLLHMTKLNA